MKECRSLLNLVSVKDGVVHSVPYLQHYKKEEGVRLNYPRFLPILVATHQKPKTARASVPEIWLRDVFDQQKD